MRENTGRRSPHGLQFNVAQLLKEPTGASRSYEINSRPVETLTLDVDIVAPIVGDVKFLRTGVDILVTGHLETRIHKVCGRCLNDFTFTAIVEIEEIFYPSIDVVTGIAIPAPVDADEANRINPQHILDLWEVVRQDFLLASEDVRYCRPDCQGLCPYCGQDLNIAPCTCKNELIDERWAGLLSIQLEDK